MIGDVCAEWLTCLVRHPERRTIYLYSPGGDLGVARACWAVMKGRGYKVVVMGYCGSAALAILAAADVRVALPGSYFYFHRPYSSPPSRSRAEDLSDIAGELSWDNEWLASISTHGDAELKLELLERTKAGGWTFDEMVASGLNIIQDIVTARSVFGEAPSPREGTRRSRPRRDA